MILTLSCQDLGFGLSGFRVSGFVVLESKQLKAYAGVCRRLLLNSVAYLNGFDLKHLGATFFLGHRGPNGGDDGVVCSFSKNDR